MTGGYLTVASLSCTHCPLHDQEAIDWASGELERIRPDVLIHQGDLLEASAASRWENEDDHDLLDEYVAGAQVLKQLREAAGTSRCIWLHGNHDDNIRKKGRIDRRVRRLLDWNERDPEFRRWRQFPYRFRPEGCYQIGQVLYVHGVTSRQHLEAIQWNNLTGGYAHRLVVMGHTHAPHAPLQVMRTNKIPMPLWYANVGNMRQDADWAFRQDTAGWQPGLMVVRVKPGRACRTKREWSAELLQPEWV